jgi:phage tail-like protein
MTESLRAKLIITSPDEPERVFEVERPVVRIGREQEQSDLVLAHGWVSRAHARLYADRLPLRIQDMRSSNGTLVNDQPLPAEEIRPLQDGDVIAIGPFRLRYQAPAAAQPPEPPRRQGEPLAGLGVRRAPVSAEPPPPPKPPADETVAQPLLEPWVGMPQRASRWLQYLPPIYSDDEFLGRFLLLFEDLLGPVQQSIAHFGLYLDPQLAPKTFVPWLNEWLAEMVDEHWSLDVQRELLRQAGWLYQARGTKAGLLRFLRICTGCDTDLAENEDGPHTVRVTLHCAGQEVDRGMVQRIVQANCPAHVTFSIRFV